MQIKRNDLLQGVKSLETVNFDIAMLRQALLDETDTIVRESLNRIAGDLNVAN